jgi:hypothetical protein
MQPAPCYTDAGFPEEGVHDDQVRQNALLRALRTEQSRTPQLTDRSKQLATALPNNTLQQRPRNS